MSDSPCFTFLLHGSMLFWILKPVLISTHPVSCGAVCAIKDDDLAVFAAKEPSKLPVFRTVSPRCVADGGVSFGIWEKWASNVKKMASILSPLALGYLLGAIKKIACPHLSPNHKPIPELPKSQNAFVRTEFLAKPAELWRTFETGRTVLCNINCSTQPKLSAPSVRNPPRPQVFEPYPNRFAYTYNDTSPGGGAP